MQRKASKNSKIYSTQNYFMQEQNYKNHTRLVVGFHYVAFTLIVLFIIGSIVNLFHAEKSNVYSASLLVLIGIISVFSFWYMRVFALKAQDRAIRAEENFRYFILTGKPLPASLRISQIIALRFASDEELVQLTADAVAQNLSSKQIKLAIKNWKADTHRV